MLLITAQEDHGSNPSRRGNFCLQLAYYVQGWRLWCQNRPRYVNIPGTCMYLKHYFIQESGNIYLPQYSTWYATQDRVTRPRFFNFAIRLWLDLGYKALIFASMTILESGPCFADIWHQLKSIEILRPNYKELAPGSETQFPRPKARTLTIELWLFPIIGYRKTMGIWSNLLLLYISTSVWVLRTPNAGRNRLFQRFCCKKP